MSGGRSVWRAAAWGAGCGVLGGLAVGSLYYLYGRLTHPSPYDAVMLAVSAPVFAVLGGLAGLLAAAWYSSD